MSNVTLITPYKAAGQDLFEMFFISLALLVCSTLSFFYPVRPFAALGAALLGVIYAIWINKFVGHFETKLPAFVVSIAGANVITTFLKNLYALEPYTTKKVITEVVYLITDTILVFLICSAIIRQLVIICKSLRYTQNKKPIAQANALVFLSSLAFIANVVSNVFIRIFYNKLAEMILEIYNLNSDAFVNALGFLIGVDGSKLEESVLFNEKIPELQITLAALTVGGMIMFLLLLFFAGLYFTRYTIEIDEKGEV